MFLWNCVIWVVVGCSVFFFVCVLAVNIDRVAFQPILIYVRSVQNISHESTALCLPPGDWQAHSWLS